MRVNLLMIAIIYSAIAGCGTRHGTGMEQLTSVAAGKNCSVIFDDTCMTSLQDLNQSIFGETDAEITIFGR